MGTGRGGGMRGGSGGLCTTISGAPAAPALRRAWARGRPPLGRPTTRALLRAGDELVVNFRAAVARLCAVRFAAAPPLGLSRAGLRGFVAFAMADQPTVCGHPLSNRTARERLEFVASRP